MLSIVNYGVGNLSSVQNMARKACGAARLVTTPDEIRESERLILPGVGHFGHVVQTFEAAGLKQAVIEHAFEKKKPLLGICVGAQILGTGSEEAPSVPGLGWLPFACRRFPNTPGLRVPHMSWNTLAVKRQTPLLAELDSEARFYFVHSYYMEPSDPGIVLAQTEYGVDFASVVGSGNIFGTQFHPEKSHRFGMALLRGFAQMPFEHAQAA
ncbi:imidazole glycerol phosphate synthase subunit HisH [Bosea vestrisii]|uniref:imidazole glycerol phosphate synthase subunit HisH n=1 Tax=Bosea vestrisii TaxID=151416 RepID=UPI0024E0037A|nr:imidazole glycerol phosphate synthase subunit HisH [Bosea vestrisii]WID98762.1 imidazole glycerol phosphate synthase subunit HisH [Bosea vestrisii]